MGSSHQLSNPLTYETLFEPLKTKISNTMKTISACIVLIAVIVSVSNAQIAVNPAKPYSYAYEVVDPAGGNAYGHRETSNGAGLFEGEYRVVLPDSRTQIVKYSVTAETGYVAEVSYEGTPTFPEAAPKRRVVRREAEAEPEAQRPAYNAAPAPLVVGPAKPYSYAYEVVDPAGGNAYGHRETSSGDGIISGEYRVVLPDTRTQIVKYSVSAETGYVAEVTYEGTPTFPEA